MQSETKRLGLLDFAAAKQFSPNASVRLLVSVEAHKASQTHGHRGPSGSDHGDQYGGPSHLICTPALLIKLIPDLA